MTTHPDRTYPPLLVQGQTCEEMTVGSVFRTAARTITETDLITFVTWSGFNEALFLDASHAAAGGYTGRLVPGALVYCLGEGLVRTCSSIPRPADPRPRLPAPMRRSRMSLWLDLLRRSLGPPPPPPRRYFSSRCWPAARGPARPARRTSPDAWVSGRRPDP